MARMKRVARDHEDVLQNIEFVLVNGTGDDPELDDRTVALALRACLVGKGAEHPGAGRLVRQLRQLRETRTELSDDAWRESLRVVLESVDRHSSYEPGETSYLDFAAEFFE
jgi:tRNA-dihydrouridine synthase